MRAPSAAHVTSVTDRIRANRRLASDCGAWLACLSPICSSRDGGLKPNPLSPSATDWEPQKATASSGPASDVAACSPGRPKTPSAARTTTAASVTHRRHNRHAWPYHEIVRRAVHHEPDWHVLNDLDVVPRDVPRRKRTRRRSGADRGQSGTIAPGISGRRANRDAGDTECCQVAPDRLKVIHEFKGKRYAREQRRNCIGLPNISR